MSEPGFFEILDTTRAMKRLNPDPVPLELLRKVLDAGTKAPSGVNTQPWEFLVIRDPGTKKSIQERYLHFTVERFGALVGLLPVGFPQGRFGPVTRKPEEDLTHFDRWGITADRSR
jgi:nitroreductase